MTGVYRFGDTGFILPGTTGERRHKHAETKKKVQAGMAVLPG